MQAETLTSLPQLKLQPENQQSRSYHTPIKLFRNHLNTKLPRDPLCTWGNGHINTAGDGHSYSRQCWQWSGPGVSYLIIHELKCQSRLAYPSTANHDHLVKDQGALVLALVCSHPAGFLRLQHADRRPAANEKDKDLEVVWFPHG